MARHHRWIPFGLDVVVYVRKFTNDRAESFLPAPGSIARGRICQSQLSLLLSRESENTCLVTIP